MSPTLFKIVYGLLLVALAVLIASSLSEAEGPAAPSPAVAAPPSSTATGYYPPARSKAIGMTPRWREFADTVDRVCGASFNYALALDSRAQTVARARGWSEERAESVITQIWSDEDRRIDLAAQKLGRPPKEPRLFARWHANVARRATLFHRASVVSRAGRWDSEHRIFRRIDRLKVQADRLGQRFGLRICTSN